MWVIQKQELICNDNANYYAFSPPNSRRLYQKDIHLKFWKSESIVEIVLTFTQTSSELFSICVRFELIHFMWMLFVVRVRWRESHLHSCIANYSLTTLRGERKPDHNTHAALGGYHAPWLYFYFSETFICLERISCSVFYNRMETRDDFLWWNYSAHWQNINDVLGCFVSPTIKKREN